MGVGVRDVDEQVIIRTISVCKIDEFETGQVWHIHPLQDRQTLRGREDRPIPPSPIPSVIAEIVIVPRPVAKRQMGEASGVNGKYVIGRVRISDSERAQANENGGGRGDLAEDGGTHKGLPPEDGHRKFLEARQSREESRESLGLLLAEIPPTYREAEQLRPRDLSHAQNGCGLHGNI